MNAFFVFLKSVIIFLSSIIIIPLFLTIFNLFKFKTNKLTVIIIGTLLMFILGIITGKSSNNKGYLKGLLLSLITIFILVILSLIFKFPININTLIYYIILIIATTGGAMLGINKKNKK